jgi:outer membrane lipoprotein SlyB
MKQVIFAIFAVLFAVACTPTERGAAVGGLTGAAVGGVVTGDVQGAAIGGAVGAVAGALIGRAQEPGLCIYEDRFGRRYTAACP